MKAAPDTGKPLRADNVHLPLEPLFTLLHENGFRVKPDDYVEMLKIVERYGSESIDETAQWICPLVATSAEEQGRFYLLVDAYKKGQSGTDEAVVPPPKIFPWWLFIPVLLLAVFVFWWLQRPRPFPDTITPLSLRVKRGDTIHLDAMELFRGREKDTSKVRVSWKIGKEPEQEGLSTRYVAKESGPLEIIRKFSSPRIPLKFDADTSALFVCSQFPEIRFAEEAMTAYVDSPLVMEAAVLTGDTSRMSFTWIFEDTSIITPDPVLKNYRFSQEGQVFVVCRADPEEGIACSSEDTLWVEVRSKEASYQASFTHAKPKQPAEAPVLKWWVHAAFLLPSVLGIAYGMKPRKKKRREVKPAEPAGGDKPVYDIPFERRDLKLVQPEKDQRMFTLQLRMKAEEENLVLHIPWTIQGIIRSGGSPQLVFTPQTRSQDYLVLIDRTNPKSMMTRLFEYLAGSLHDNGIPVTVFYYDEALVCYNQANPAGIPLAVMAYQYEKSTLLMMGQGYQLIFTPYPSMDERILSVMNNWVHKALITPLPVNDWGNKEKAIREHLIILPADIQCLQYMMPAMHEKIRVDAAYLEATNPDAYSARDTDFQDADELKEYLGNDEALFQWVCAINVYPKLRWEVFIEIGKTILDKYGQPEKLNYTTLLKLCRISWMQEGYLPSATRLELLKRLTVDNEVAARKTLREMLVQSALLFPGGEYAYEEERVRQQRTSEFILYSHDLEAFREYSGTESYFRELWEKDRILDEPLKQYLERAGKDSWETPVKVHNRPASLGEYFREAEKAPDPYYNLRKILSIAGSLLTMAVWAWLLTGFRGESTYASGLYTGKENAQVLYDVNLQRDLTECPDTTATVAASVDAQLYLGERTYQGTYDPATGNARFSMLPEDYRNAKGNLWIRVGQATGRGGLKSGSGSLMLPVDFSQPELPDTLRIECRRVVEPPPTPGPVRGFVPISIADLSVEYMEIWAGQGAAPLLSFDIPRQYLYYSDKDRSRYQRYRMDSLFRDDRGNIRLLASAGESVLVFQFSRIRNSRFTFFLCGEISGNAVDWDVDSMSCTGSISMSVFYDRNPDNIYLPLSGGRLVASEKTKLDRKAAAIRSQGSPSGVGFELYENNQGMPGINSREIALSALKGSSINVPVSRNGMPANINYRTLDPYNPFNRSYLRVNIPVTNVAKNPTPPTNLTVTAPDCSKTFYSMDDVQKDPLAICRLDLQMAYLRELPALLYECKNMQSLTLGQTDIPESSIKALQSALPRCKISYSIAQPDIRQQENSNAPVQQEAARFVQDRIVNFSTPGRIPNADNNYFNALAKAMAGYPDSKVRLVGYFRNESDRNNAVQNVSTIVKILMGARIPNVEQRVLQEYRSDNAASFNRGAVPSQINRQVAWGNDEAETAPGETWRVVVFLAGFPSGFKVAGNASKSEASK